MTKLLVTGSKGFIGSTFKEFSTKDLTIIDLPREVDLRNYKAVRYAFERIKPDILIHAAGRVGGMSLNLSNPVSQFTDNVLINTNTIDAAYHSGVTKLIALSSSACYPFSRDPLTEEMFQIGIPNTFYRSYAYTKRAMDIHIEAYRTQYDVDYCSLVFASAFGEADTYTITDSHVVAGLIARAGVAARDGLPYRVWGNGSDSREFTYYRDIAKICIELSLHRKKLPQRINLSSGQEYTIKELAKIIAKKFNIKKIEWESTEKAKSYPGKLDTYLLSEYLPKFSFTYVPDAIENCCDYYINNIK